MNHDHGDFQNQGDIRIAIRKALKDLPSQIEPQSDVTADLNSQHLTLLTCPEKCQMRERKKCWVIFSKPAFAGFSILEVAFRSHPEELLLHVGEQSWKKPQVRCNYRKKIGLKAQTSFDSLENVTHTGPETGNCAPRPMKFSILYTLSFVY